MNDKHPSQVLAWKLRPASLRPRYRWRKRGHHRAARGTRISAVRETLRSRRCSAGISEAARQPQVPATFSWPRPGPRRAGCRPCGSGSRHEGMTAPPPRSPAAACTGASRQVPGKDRRLHAPAGHCRANRAVKQSASGTSADPPSADHLSAHTKPSPVTDCHELPGWPPARLLLDATERPQQAVMLLLPRATVSLA